ncbi:nucleotide-binding protein [Nocardia sp. R7R-8]|uniref:nucleotide-binding protein n=1 Tax=Nocardia sp. R7R-8 TaxID=3459304 RepID=UPI00403E0A52
MSRSNDGLPMLPPWLSESEVSQSGYEAPVQNLPHDDLIEETPSRRRGRLRGRAPEAERPEGPRPEKRRKGWRRDKHEEHAEEEQGLGEASRAPAAAPEQPAPARPPHESWPPHDSRQQPRDSWQQQETWQQPGYDRDSPVQDNSWQAPPERTDVPPHSLPTRNPSQPSPGFQPLGSRPAHPSAPSEQQAHRQADPPDLPPPPPRQSADEQPAPTQNDEHARPSHAQSAPGQTVGGPPPLGPQHGGWPSTGNPRLDAALSAVAPSLWPNSAPPGRSTPSVGPSPTGHEAAQSGGESRQTAPAGPSQTWPAAAPTGGDTGMPSTGESPVEPHGENTVAEASRSVAAAQAPTMSAGPELGHDTSGAGATAPSSEAGQMPPTAGPAAQAVAPGPPAVTPDGPPPWLGAPRPEQADASATDAPRRLPPLPDPPAPRERPRTGGSGSAATAAVRDGHRPPPPDADGPPPGLGHGTPERSGRPDRPGLPPAPNETAASPDPARVDDSAPEIRVPADPRPPSHPRPADHGITEPAAASTTGPHAGQGGVAAPPAPFSAAMTGAPPTSGPQTHPQPVEAAVEAPGAQPDPGVPTPNGAGATEADHAAARSVGGGRHRLSAEPNEPSSSQPPVERAPDVDQQPVPQPRPDSAYDAGGAQQPPHGGSGAFTAPATQFASGQAPGTAPPDPADQWRNAAAPESGPVAPYSVPAHPAAAHHTPQWGTPPGYPQPPAPQPPAPQPGAPFQRPSLDDVPLRRAKKSPGTGWRKAVHHVSGGAINPGMSAEERRLQELVARIRQPVRGDYRIAVLSLKGGVGKTTTTMGLGSTFASIRGDRVIAVDANPDFGTLSQRVPLQTRSTVRDLLLDSAIQRYSDVRRHTSQATSRLEVLASERDPAASEAFSEEEYRAVARILQRFYNIILTDCGTGLMHSAMTGVLDLAHSLVLISSPAIDGARSAAATLDWLSLHGHDHLVRNAVVVINSPRAGSPNVGIQQLREYFLSRCRAVHIIPFDPHMSEGAEIDLHRLHKQTKRAYVELAATVADDFATDHRRYRP